ncbi:hypothetical protein IB245_08215 [Pseudomonas sp. PDM02]|uniref:hypothetical protein n=1 Tax=Pseudomonas sp. PDM02 TaxID=2769267 RepID=UPI0017858284|nr:hypothetical protein [Pseudomonas sp. PDM02]MBD9611476.1 hypothetical protein [Pseudomonas sp. PDM02]
MSNETPENKYESGSNDDQSGGVRSSNTSSFFDSCTKFEIVRGLDAEEYRYLANYKSGKIVIPDDFRSTRFELTMKAPLDNQYMFVSSDRHHRVWDGFPPSPFSIRISLSAPVHINKHIFTFASSGVTSELNVFFAPFDLSYFTSYKLNGEDVGKQDLLLHYNVFYSLELYNLDNEDYEFIRSSKIKSISYDKDAPYTIDFIGDEELVENESGDSSIDGLSSAGSKTMKMTGGVRGLRVRYKNPNNPYFGRLDVTLHFEEGMVLKPPIEVVKRVEV